MIQYVQARLPVFVFCAELSLPGQQCIIAPLFFKMGL